MTALRSLTAFLLLAVASAAASAATLIAVSDRELVGRADAVVVATVGGAEAREHADGFVYTEYRFEVEEVLKGKIAAGSLVTVAEVGGLVPHKGLVIEGSATYAKGDRVLAFLRQRPDGTYYTASMELGRFRYTRDAYGRALVVRETHESGATARDAKSFEDFVRKTARNEAAPAVDPIALRGLEANTVTTLATGPGLYCLTGGAPSLPLRKNCPGACTMTFKFNGTIAGLDVTGAMNRGAAAWTNDPVAFISLTIAGTSNVTVPALDGENTIIYNYSAAVPNGICDGSSACTIGWSDGNTHTYGGDTFYNIIDSDIIFRPITFSQAALDTLETHEFGHAMGLRHSDAGTPSSSNAVMASFVNAAIGANLRQWDKDAVDTVYGPGAVCSQPSITAQSGNATVAQGQTITLSVTATGSTPLTYQWYDGLSGDTTNAVGSNQPTFTTPPINSTKNYWVKVSNTCGAANSTTITLTPAACAKPNITLEPQSQTLASGASVQLSVGHGGTSPFSYQWYLGNTGDVSNPVAGETNRTFNTPAITKTTSYWVRITNSCGSADSQTATLTIQGQCAAPSFTLQPVSANVPRGSQQYLSAIAPDATSYQWYQGATGDTSTPLTGLTPSSDRFVRQAFLDLLGRPADAAALSALVGPLDAGTLTRNQAATSILTSTEYRSLLVSGYYGKYLHRTPSAAEVTFWMPAFVSGLTDEQIASQILGSPEYLTLAGGTSDLWLTRAFGDILGRDIDPSSRTFYTALLASSSRTAVALQLLNSTEARTKRLNDYFNAYLHRSPTGTEGSSFLGAMAGGAKNEVVQALIIASAEYTSAGTIYFTNPLNATTSFWVKAINACGTANSAAATLTVPQCAPPVLVTQPANVTINVGDVPALSVVATSPDAIGYQWYEGTSGNTATPVAGATSAVFNGPALFTAGTKQYWVKVTNACGGTVNSNSATVTVNCGTPKAIKLTAPPVSPSSLSYVLTWTGDSRLYSRYEVQEATKADFSNATTLNAQGTSLTISSHSGGVNTDTRFYYRVRGFLVCSGQAAPYSSTASTLVTAPLAPVSSGDLALSAPPCASNPCTINATISLGGFGKSGKGALDIGNPGDTFTITSDKPFVTVNPSSGTIGANGTPVNVSVDASKLDIGSVQATLTLTVTPAGSGKTALATLLSNFPINVSLVSPVTPAPKDTNAPANSLIIPAIAHADGIGSRFVSDVRITNTSSQRINYQLAFTPTATDGTTAGKQSTIALDPGETKALNDIVGAFYGSGTQGETGLGTLEVRPLDYSGKGIVSNADSSPNGINLATIAASRTYNVAPNGTFGQFIPAVPLASFLGKSDVAKISLQQVAQSASYRTNLGFVEGSGQPVDMVVKLLSDSGALVAQRNYSLKAFEHQQISMGAFFPGASVNDGRIEVTVTSDGGRVTAYASVLDNNTSDPLLVFPVDPSRVVSQRYVVPGVAELNNGAANFHTDMRVFNGGAQPSNLTVAYVTSDRTPPAPVQMHIDPGQTLALDNVLQSVWNLSGTGGAVVVTSDANSSLVVTARTFSRRDDGGTFGQFIPGVTATDAVGAGERALQVVQLEQSPQFRSNLGLVEVTGSPVTIEVTGYAPDSRVEPRITRDLAPGQFVQMGSIFAALGMGNVYNGRVSVKVLSGDGRVAAYGSVIDNRTQDPTYVPAQ